MSVASSVYPYKERIVTLTEGEPAPADWIDSKGKLIRPLTAEYFDYLRKVEVKKSQAQLKAMFDDAEYLHERITKWQYAPERLGSKYDQSPSAPVVLTREKAEKFAIREAKEAEKQRKLKEKADRLASAYQNKLRKIPLYRDALAQALNNPKVIEHLKTTMIGYDQKQSAYDWFVMDLFQQWKIMPYIYGQIGIEEFLAIHDARYGNRAKEQAVLSRHETCKDAYDIIKMQLKGSGLKIKSVT